MRLNLNWVTKMSIFSCKQMWQTFIKTTTGGQKLFMGSCSMPPCVHSCQPFCRRNQLNTVAINWLPFLSFNCSENLEIKTWTLCLSATLRTYPPRSSFSASKWSPCRVFLFYISTYIFNSVQVSEDYKGKLILSS